MLRQTMAITIGGIIGFSLGKVSLRANPPGTNQVIQGNSKGFIKYLPLGSGILGAMLLPLMVGKYGGGELMSLSMLTILLMTCTLWDLREQLIPNSVILLGILMGFSALAINPALGYLEGLLGMGILGGSFGLLAILSKEAIGMGDAKLIACIGLFIGLWHGLTAVLLSSMLAGVFGLGCLAVKGAGKKTTFPFAPFLLVGTMVVLLIK